MRTDERALALGQLNWLLAPGARFGAASMVNGVVAENREIFYRSPALLLHIGEVVNVYS